MTVNVLYTAEATAKGGREGWVESSDGRIDLDLRIPKEMGGPGEGSNPEELFAAGYAACFHSALRLVGKGDNVDVDASTVTAKVGIGMDDTGGFGLKVALEVALPGVEPTAAQSLVEKAHQVCPYSKATRGNIDVELSVV